MQAASTISHTQFNQSSDQEATDRSNSSPTGSPAHTDTSAQSSDNPIDLSQANPARPTLRRVNSFSRLQLTSPAEGIDFNTAFINGRTLGKGATCELREVCGQAVSHPENHGERINFLAERARTLSLPTFNSPYLMQPFAMTRSSTADGGVYASDQLGGPQLLQEMLDGRFKPTIDHQLQLCEAVLELHRHNILHRDIKPTNCMVIEQEDGSKIIQLCDFGFALTIPCDPDKAVEDVMHYLDTQTNILEGISNLDRAQLIAKIRSYADPTIPAGTESYQSPSLWLPAIKSDPTTHTPRKSDDIYSLGISLINMAIGGLISLPKTEYKLTGLAQLKSLQMRYVNKYS